MNPDDTLSNLATLTAVILTPRLVALVGTVSYRSWLWRARLRNFK